MKRVLDRVLALVIAAAVTLALGVGFYWLDRGVLHTGGAGTTAEVPDGVTFLPDNATDVPLEVAGVAHDAALLTAFGQPVTAEHYLYWLGNMTAYYKNLYFQYTYQDLDLTQEVEPGVTWDQRMKELARQNAVLLQGVPELAARYGVSLTEQDLQSLVTQRELEIQSAGGEAMYAYQLQGIGISDRSDFEMGRRALLFQRLQENFTARALGTQQGGQGEVETVSDEKMDAYIEEADLLRAKHILLMTIDPATRESLSDEEKAAKREKADALLRELRESDDPETLFDRLMNENSEDTGLATNPDGYLFTAGEMVSEFETGTRALAVGEISEVIESSYGYHIILRLDADCDAARTQWAADRFNEMVGAYVDSANVQESPEYANISAAQYYEGLMAFQQTLPVPAEGGADTETQTPPLETAEP